MLNQKNIELIYDTIDESCMIMYEKLEYDYYSSVIETLKNILGNRVYQELDVETSKQLLEIYSKIDVDLDSEEIRKALQLAILKGIKHILGTNDIMTPDTIGLLFAYLINKFNTKDNIKIFDPACGTSNLLTTIANNIDAECSLFGFDIDPTQVKLAELSCELQAHDAEMFYNDSKEVRLYDMDFVVADFDKDTQHDILVNQISSLRDNGWMIALIYNDFFMKEEYRTKIMEEAFLQGLIQLPTTMFKNDGKSIILIQKKGTCKQREFLLTKLESITDVYSVNNAITKIEEWLRRK